MVPHQRDVRGALGRALANTEVAGTVTNLLAFWVRWRGMRGSARARSITGLIARDIDALTARRIALRQWRWRGWRTRAVWNQGRKRALSVGVR